MNRQPRNEALASVHEAVADLYGLGLVNRAVMRRFDDLCLDVVPQYSPDEIRSLRERFNLSQAALASIINSSPNSIQKWEKGAKKPSGAALKLLNLLDRKGLEAII